MIYLNQNNSNEVITTLYEGCTNVTNPYFYWRLIDKNTFDVIKFTSDDHSNNPYYYNAFTVSVFSLSGTATPYGLTNGTIYANAGTYDYTVFEITNPYDYSTSNTVGVAEVGILKINGTYSQYVINTGNDNSTIVVNKNLNYYDQ